MGTISHKDSKLIGFALCQGKVRLIVVLTLKEMPLKNSYVIWNNKGGVGKTTLAFHLATQYAIDNPHQKVLLIDLCPQANVSMALVGPEGTLHRFAEKKTISFYLQQVTKPLSKVNPADFLTEVSKYNTKISSNVNLLCGDMHLELVSRSLEHKRQEDADPDFSPWVFITSAVRYFIEGCSDRMQGVTEDPSSEWVVFIDTNPSFSTYTEIALVAAEKLIIPVNADDFSRQAIKAMFDLVYGIEGENIPAEFKDYRRRMFSHKVILNKVRRPKIHLLINNRSTKYKLRSAKAFQDMADSNLEVLFAAYEKHKECFVPLEGHVIPKGDISCFGDHYIEDMQDFHTTGILSLHARCPLAKLKGKIELCSRDVNATSAQVKPCLQHLQKIVRRL